MSFDELERSLREHYGGAREPARPSASEETRALALFDELVSAGELPVEARAGTVVELWREHRRRFVAAAGLALMIGACALPAEVPTELGIGLAFESPSGTRLPVEEIAQAAARRAGAEEVSVQAHGDDEHVSVHIGLWGAEIDAETLAEGLREDFPELVGLELRSEALEGRVHTNLGGALMHEIFDRSFADGDIEAARAAVLADLQARGVKGEVRVDVQDVPDGRQVRVEVREMHP